MIARDPRRTYRQRRASWLAALVGTVAAVWPTESLGQPLGGSSTLLRIPNTPGAWGLKIVVLNLGEPDAILVMTPNGDVCLIDSGKSGNTAGDPAVEYLGSKTRNGVGNLKTIDLLYTTHYDLDHIGGLPRIVENGITVCKAFDQGLSLKRRGRAGYLDYVPVLVSSRVESYPGSDSRSNRGVT